jgi:hypothetical protein
MLCNGVKNDTISKTDIEIMREKVLYSALSLAPEEKNQLIRFIEGGLCHERANESMVHRRENG